MTRALATALAVALSGCATIDAAFRQATGNPAATDPTERGLSYVAMAIVVSAFVRGVMNK